MFKDFKNLTQSTAFPPPDLMRTLIDLFFRYVTPFFPIIHRPTFEAQYADRLHERDSHHAQLLFMVCAVASVYSDDPRVYQEVRGVPVPGYKYFVEVSNWSRSLAAARLSDLQACLVCTLSLLVIPVNAYHPAVNCPISHSCG